MPDRRALTSPINGRKSQGPKTPRGKGVSRFNATKHGLLARHLLVDDGVAPETAAEMRRLYKQLRAELAPEGIVEEMLVERILVAYWRLRRVLVAERAIISRNTERRAESTVEVRALIARLRSPVRTPTVTAADEEAMMNAVEAALLPNGDQILRIARYERPLQRQFYQALQELRTAQRQRLAHDPQAAPPPAAPTQDRGEER